MIHYQMLLRGVGENFHHWRWWPPNSSSYSYKFITTPIPTRTTLTPSSSFRTFLQDASKCCRGGNNGEIIVKRNNKKNGTNTTRNTSSSASSSSPPSSSSSSSPSIHKTDNNQEVANKIKKLQSRQQVQEMRQRMRRVVQPSHINNPEPSSSSSILSPSHQGKEWDSLWNDGITPWDLGRATPALQSELHRQYFHNNNNNNNDDHSQQCSILQQQPLPRRCLIPGCGSGYDLVAMAKYFESYNRNNNNNNSNNQQYSQQEIIIVGLEISSTSLERAQHVIRSEMAVSNKNDDTTTTSSSSYLQHQENSSSSPSFSCHIELYQGDFFDSPSSWNQIMTTSANTSTNNDQQQQQQQQLSQQSSSSSSPSQFDFIFDYLFFCAIPPDLRSNWGQQMSQLLSQPPQKTNKIIMPPTTIATTTIHEEEQDEHKNYNNGQLLTLMFPYASSSSSSSQQQQQQQSRSPPPMEMTGPPYPVTVEDYRTVLEPYGLVLQQPKKRKKKKKQNCKDGEDDNYDEDDHDDVVPYTSPDTIPERQGQERVGWWSFI